MTQIEYIPDFVTAGRLEDLSLPMLVFHLLDRKLTGTLHLDSDNDEAWIFFSQGFPAGTALSDSPNYLGSILQELGFIDDATYNDSLMETANTGRPLGQVLIDKKKITADQHQRTVTVQLARKLTHLFSHKTGAFRFVENEEPPPPFAPARVKPYALIYNGIRNNYNEDDLKRGLAKLNGKSCRLSHLFAESRELFDFSPDEAQDLALLREFRLPQEYASHVQSGATMGMMLLLTLLSCGMIEVAKASLAQPLSNVSFHETPILGATNEVGVDLRKKVDEKYEKIKTADLWGILEIEKNADIEKVKKSYMTLAKVYHPDRMTDANDKELTQRMEVIFGRISEAFQILSEPEKRTAFIKENAAGSDKKTSARPEEAYLQFQKAMVYLKKHDFINAAECIHWALELDQNNGEYQSYRFWIEYLKGAEPEAERIVTAKTNLLDVAKRFPGCFTAMRFLTLIFGKLKDQTNYEQYLVKAQSINPNDIEVAREIRLLTMRKEHEKRKGLIGTNKK
jgi:curved DNA-binding protein CbpA